jgi:hypothetical protein
MGIYGEGAMMSSNHPEQDVSKELAITVTWSGTERIEKRSS